jgi:hypothetical protein
MIEEYKFGVITVDGKNYEEDLWLDWEGGLFVWKRGHDNLVSANDVIAAVEINPEVIVIGTGRDGLLEISEEAQDLIMQKGIKLIIDKTEEAVRTFNILKEDSLEEEGRQCRVAGFFHLTD